MRIVALFAFVLAVGCSSSAPAPASSPPAPAYSSGPIAATLNDVSILFPVPSSAADMDKLLAASDHGPRGTLLPEELYTNGGALSGSVDCPRQSNGDEGDCPVLYTPYASLHVVAMRIDPCFAETAPDPHGAGCTPQLRLVFQELDDQTDSALHAFYQLDRDELLGIAQAIVALRVQNGGATSGALAPHPLMVSQGLAGPFAQGVEQLILQHVGGQNLVRIAELGILNNDLAAMWTMEANDIIDASAGTISNLPVPTTQTQTDGESVGQTIEQNHLSAGQFTLSPGTTATDSYALLIATPLTTVTPALQDAFAGLVHVESPTRNTFNTIDCASCHLATPTEQMDASQLMLDDRTNADSFQPDTRFVAQADMTATLIPVAPVNGDVNLHAFSYDGLTPSINQRVVNETAFVVAYLNQLP